MASVTPSLLSINRMTTYINSPCEVIANCVRAKYATSGNKKQMTTQWRCYTNHHHVYVMVIALSSVLRHLLGHYQCFIF